METNSVPLMVHTGKDGKIIASEIGPHRIISYLLNL